MARSISIGIPSGELKLSLWEGTEDQRSFKILGVNSKQPYVKAYGIRYDLTAQEIKHMRSMIGAFKK